MYKIPIDHNMQFKKNSLRNVLILKILYLIITLVSQSNIIL